MNVTNCPFFRVLWWPNPHKRYRAEWNSIDDCNGDKYTKRPWTSRNESAACSSFFFGVVHEANRWVVFARNANDNTLGLGWKEAASEVSYGNGFHRWGETPQFTAFGRGSALGSGATNDGESRNREQTFGVLAKTESWSNKRCTKKWACLRGPLNGYKLQLAIGLSMCLFWFEVNLMNVFDLAP